MTLISVTFVNPDHDYPQKIRYERKGTRLTAVISKMNGEEPRVFERRQCTDRSPLHP